MRTVRQRPLTTTFIAASALLTLILPARGSGAEWLMALMVGQFLALGGWLALGRTHRLVRGAVCLIVATGLALLLEIRTTERIDLGNGEWVETDTWGLHLAIAFVMSAGAAGSSVICAALMRRMGRESYSQTDCRWRFPMRELLAWTAIVAVASFILRAAEWAELGGDANGLLVIAITTFVAGLIMAMFLTNRSVSVLPCAVLAIAAIAVAVGIAASIEPGLDAVGVAMLATMYGYVLLWIIVQRADGRLAPSGLRADGLLEGPATAPADGMLEVCPPSANAR